MRFPNRGGFGDSRGQNSDNRGPRRDFDRPTMHDAVCAKCGSDCQVPFVPNGRKEIFCSKCFEEMGGGESRDSRSSFSDRGPSRFGDRDSRGPRSFGNRDRSPRGFSDRQMFNAICSECGTNCQIPFEPRSGKPIFCSNCFAKKEDGQIPADKSYPAPRPSNSVALAEINTKLDKLISLLSPSEPKKAAKKAEKNVEVKVEEVVPVVEKKAKIAKKKVVA
jgi:CxxC-x17-CxxC domain-containing protein